MKDDKAFYQFLGYGGAILVICLLALMVKQAFFDTYSIKTRERKFKPYKNETVFNLPEDYNERARDWEQERELDRKKFYEQYTPSEFTPKDVWDPSDRKGMDGEWDVTDMTSTTAERL